MKIILLEDVKGKGKKHQIIDQPSGYAMFLIRGNKALVADDANIAKLEQQQEEAAIKEEELVAEMKELKAFIEKNPVKIMVKAGDGGRIFGTVSTKQVVQEYQKKYDIKLDKKKMSMLGTMNALGTYKITLQLHKDVEAVLQVMIGEK